MYCLPAYLIFSPSKGSSMTSNKLSVQPSDSYFYAFRFREFFVFFIFLSFLRKFHKERLKRSFDRFQHSSIHRGIV